MVGDPGAIVHALFHAAAVQSLPVDGAKTLLEALNGIAQSASGFG
jgi:hypothetical protein